MFKGWALGFRVSGLGSVQRAKSRPRALQLGKYTSNYGRGGGGGPHYGFKYITYVGA